MFGVWTVRSRSAGGSQLPLHLVRARWLLVIGVPAYVGGHQHLAAAVPAGLGPGAAEAWADAGHAVLATPFVSFQAGPDHR